MLTDSRDTTVLLASRASDLGATEFLAHFQARAARRTPFCPVPRPTVADESGLFDDYLGPEVTTGLLQLGSTDDDAVFA